MTRRSVAYQKFFAELKRRRVFNSAALYGGVAFVVFQAADFVLPALHLSESVATAIVWISIIGFPFAMLAAWFVDLTSGGLRITSPPKAGELESIVAQPALLRWPVGIAAVVGVALLAAGVGWHFSGKEASGSLAPLRAVPTIGSVAVLPFLSMTQGEDDSYFSEGVAAELLEALGRVPGLEVTARTSAFSFAGSAVDLQSVARELKVASILDGSVGFDGDTVELALHLLAAGGGEDAWSGVFRLPKEGFLSALDEVAWTVAAQLGVEVQAEGSQPLVITSTEDFRAYRDYLQGRRYSYGGTPEALELAIDSYNRSLLLDPEFAPAWAALATAYVLLPEYGGPPMMEILPYVEAVLDRAMRPGVERGEGYAASGYLKWAYLWKYSEAEEDFRKALELNADNPVSHYWYAQFLVTQRRWEEGLAQADMALALDPLSPAAHWTRGLVLFCAGLEGATASFLRALELAPDMHVAAYVLAGHLAMDGDLEGAAKEFDLFSSLTGTDPSAFRAYLAARADPARRPEAVAAFQGSGFYGPVQGADLLADLGESDAVLNLLEEAARSRSPYLPWMNAMPQLEGLRSNSRFQSILAWVGF